MTDPRLLVPEVVQTSATDCGPACLASLLGGFGIAASYPRLRDACQTDVDGTSIDTLEVLANQLGLEAEQIVIPADHVFIPEAEALPCLAVVRLPNGFAHFLIVWRRVGNRLQVMDPATGRRWPSMPQLSAELYRHEMDVPLVEWRAFAESEEFIAPLQARMTRLSIPSGRAAAMIAESLQASGWRAIAALDASVRMWEQLAPPRLRDGRCVEAIVSTTALRARRMEGGDVVPREYWSAWPAADYPSRLTVAGAVLLRVRGRRRASPTAVSLPAEVAAAVREPPLGPLRVALGLLKHDSEFIPVVLATAIVGAAATVVIQAVLLKTLLDVNAQLADRAQRLGAVMVVLALLVAGLLLDQPLAATLAGLGRRLETRLRVIFLTRLPLIPARYFQSRLTSDMAERSHSIHAIRILPEVVGEALRGVAQLVLTAAAIVWLDPGAWLLAMLSAAAAAVIPIACQRVIGERELRARTHAVAASRFFLDVLVGLVPVRTHVADRAFRVEHRDRLSEWARSALSMQTATIAAETVQMTVGFGLAALIVLSHTHRHPESSSTLLVAFWALSIPLIGRELVAIGSDIPRLRNILLRLIEPLGAAAPAAATPAALTEMSETGPELRFERVSVVAGGHTILHGLNVTLTQGSHAAIVGASGAGKSSFLGLLLGDHVPASGRVLVDREELSNGRLMAFRQQCAWVDPAVQLWNRSLLDNLRYGAGDGAASVATVTEDADLNGVIERLPDGLQTPLGEGGALVSGGEGQRVRLGRALSRPDVRVAILDEPFRGLDAPRRRAILQHLRRTWAGATLLAVMHDVSDTRLFPRVLVMEHGTIVEDGVPEKLARDPGSRYSALLAAERELRARLTDVGIWSRMELVDGLLTPRDPDTEPAATTNVPSSDQGRVA